MSGQDDSQPPPIFDSAEWYDLSINWDARLGREIPVLCDVMAPPGEQGLLDAGCGTGHHAIALARAGYRVTGLDASEDMLRVAAGHATAAGVEIPWIQATYESMVEALDDSFDGVYCVANALAAAGSAAAVRQAVENFAVVLRAPDPSRAASGKRQERPGGRLLLHILNFDRMRDEHPCVRGPRVCEHAGIEYVSYRTFCFQPDHVVVTNVTMWKDGTWRHRTHCGRLYPIGRDELDAWLTDAGLRVEAAYGDYQRRPFDPQVSDNLIVVATKT